MKCPLKKIVHTETKEDTVQSVTDFGDCDEYNCIAYRYPYGCKMIPHKDS